MALPHVPGRHAAPIERKVSVASIVTYLGGIAIMAVLTAVADTNILTALPPVAEVFIAPLIPAALSFVGGYTARHTPRGIE